MIDLRSDAVKPSPKVRCAMAEAVTGDELYGEDPTTRRLEKNAAEILRKEAAVCVPTCTMGNALAVIAHGCERDHVQEVAAQGVKVSFLAADRIRILIHRDLTDACVDRTIAILDQIIRERLNVTTI